MHSLTPSIIKVIVTGNTPMQKKPYLRNASSLMLRVTVFLMLAGPLASAAEEEQQTTYKSAESAVEALLSALQDEGDDAIIDMFGRQYEEQLIGADIQASRTNRAIAARAMKTRTNLVDDGSDRKILTIGSEDWPLPFPLVSERGRWRFDTEAGIEEVVNRRVGRNELDAISSCRAYIDAQVVYAAKDRDGDEVREYARLIASTEGKYDGLYWEATPGAEESPFGPLAADAEAYLRGGIASVPLKGYLYKILTRQGANTPGGRYDYIINGNMIAGFGLIAFPADHGNSGVMTFMCNHLDRVYERDFGPDGDLVAAGIDEFDIDASWKLVGE